MMHEERLNTRVSALGRAVRYGLITAVAAVMGVAFLWSPTASGAAQCSIVGSIGFVVATGDGPVVISRDAGGSLSNIRVNGQSCGPIGLISKMVIQPAVGNQDIIIDQTNGRFEPGLGSESGGIAELEFEIDGGLGTDSLRIIGTSGNDVIAFGMNGVALNNDADVDITKVVGLESFAAEGRGGADLISGAGGTNGTTGAFTSPIRFVGGTGNDTLQGGSSSSDLADYAGAPTGVVVDLRAGTATGDGSDTLTAIEQVNGTPFNDIVTFKPDQIEAAYLLGGDDVCKQVSRGVNDGGVEGDTCDGGPGNDTYDGSGILRNSPGISIDFINGIVSGSGPDFIPGVENAVGTEGDDEVTFKPDQINVAQMLGGDDVCKQVSRGVNDGGVEGDTCDGGAGRDKYDATGILRNSPGISIDFINDIVGGSGPDFIPGVEDVDGTNGEDSVTFQPDEINVARMMGGDDVCKQVSRGVNDGGVEGDTCDGGAGVDTYDASGVLRNSPGISMDFLNNIVSGSGPDFIPGVENGIGTNGDDNFIDADNDCNLVRGGAGDDVWVAGSQRPGSENDPQRGQCGDDVDLGEGGEVLGDLLDYTNTVHNSPGVLIDLANGIVSGSPEDKGANAERARGSGGDDRIIGNSEDNVLEGGDGDDVISGGGGNDTMDGGAGFDTLTSSGSDDGITCNNGQPQAGEGDSATSFEGCQGGSGNDVIYGTNGDDILYGGGGNDTIYGLNGNDTIYGEDGDDFIDGGNGNDTLYGGAGNDEIHGGANGGDTLYGEAGDDQLFGGNGPDSLDGGEGIDTLDGGEGPDACIGENQTRCES